MFDEQVDFVHSVLVQFYFLLYSSRLLDQDRLRFEFCQNFQNISTEKYLKTTKNNLMLTKMKGNAVIVVSSSSKIPTK